LNGDIQCPAEIVLERDFRIFQKVLYQKAMLAEGRKQKEIKERK
jgi:hypothetical protein